MTDNAMLTNPLITIRTVTSKVQRLLLIAVSYIFLLSSFCVSPFTLLVVLGQQVHHCNGALSIKKTISFDKCCSCRSILVVATDLISLVGYDDGHLDSHQSTTDRTVKRMQR